MKNKILLIDDDIILRDSLHLMLTKRGYQIDVAQDGRSGLRKAYAFNPDLIILDIMLPDMDGWELCRHLRQVCDVPIMMLTALGSKEDVVRGLDMGADAYVVKPVTIEELQARIRTVLRRFARSKLGRSNGTPSLSHNNLVIDFSNYEVTLDRKPVDLSPTEFRLLSVLAQHKGRVLSHEFLLSEVWGPERKGDTAILHQYISYLRRKLEMKPSSSKLIRNKWNFGYQFG